MLNLFILVLMENLETNYINSDNVITQFGDLTDLFKEKWIEYSDENNIYFLKEEYHNP